MFDQILQKITGLASITIGGVSVVTLICSLIVLIKAIIDLKKENRLTKSTIEQAFKNAVFPNTIKLDLSKKIEEPLKAGFYEMKLMLENTLERVTRGEQLILSILNEFSHVNKLPAEIQNEIEEYIDESKTDTIEV